MKYSQRQVNLKHRQKIRKQKEKRAQAKTTEVKAKQFISFCLRTVYLLTGMPGTGKTSIIRQLATGLGNKVGGFYTKEIRQEGV